MFDLKRIRQDFPIISREIRGKPLVYLDNAATSQKPRQVIQALVDCYEKYNSNVHRGVHTLSMEATEKYEEARKKVADFIHAPGPESIISFALSAMAFIVKKYFAKPCLTMMSNS